MPVFEVDPLREFVADPLRRLFLADLLASYTHVASGALWVKSRRGWRHRRFSELDPAQFAELILSVPPEERLVLYRRLGDLTLFLSGVFPDHVSSRPLPPIAVERLRRAVGGAASPSGGRSSPAARARGIPAARARGMAAARAWDMAAARAAASPAAPARRRPAFARMGRPPLVRPRLGRHRARRARPLAGARLRGRALSPRPPHLELSHRPLPLRAPRALVRAGRRPAGFAARPERRSRGERSAERAARRACRGARRRARGASSPSRQGTATSSPRTEPVATGDRRQARRGRAYEGHDDQMRRCGCGHHP